MDSGGTRGIGLCTGLIVAALSMRVSCPPGAPNRSRGTGATSDSSQSGKASPRPLESSPGVGVAPGYIHAAVKGAPQHSGVGSMAIFCERECARGGSRRCVIYTGRQNTCLTPPSGLGPDRRTHASDWSRRPGSPPAPPYPYLGVSTNVCERESESVCARVASVSSRLVASRASRPRLQAS